VVVRGEMGSAQVVLVEVVVRVVLKQAQDYL
jgi:hypothetical protein